MSEIAADYPDLVPVTGVAPWVQAEGDLSHSVASSGNMRWVVDAKAKEPAAAASFMEWVLGGDPEVLRPFFVDTQFTKAPARDEVTEVVNSDPAAAEASWSDVVFEDIVPNCIPEAQYPWDINEAMGAAIQAGMLGQLSPSDALAEASAEIQKVIEREDLAERRAEMDA